MLIKAIMLASFLIGSGAFATTNAAEYGRGHHRHHQAGHNGGGYHHGGGYRHGGGYHRGHRSDRYNRPYRGRRGGYRRGHRDDYYRRANYPYNRGRYGSCDNNGRRGGRR